MQLLSAQRSSKQAVQSLLAILLGLLLTGCNSNSAAPIGSITPLVDTTALPVPIGSVTAPVDTTAPPAPINNIPQVAIADSTAPNATLGQTAAILGKSAPIVITFSESMNTASLALAGTLADESNAAVWSKTRVDNDTLTITPHRSTWTSGPNRTLAVNARDLAGNAVTPIHATYLVKLVFENFDAASVVIVRPISLVSMLTEVALPAQIL